MVSVARASICIYNEDVVSFYRENPNIDPETTNSWLVNFMKLTMKTSVPLNETLASQFIDGMKHIQKSNADMIQTFNLKISDIRREIMEDMRMITTNNTNNTSEKLVALLQTHTSTFLDKNSLLFGDLLSKGNDILLREINNIKQPSDKSPVESCYNKISELRDIIVQHQKTTDILKDDMGSYFKKTENSSIKGKISENDVLRIVVDLFPNGDISSVAATKETGDIMLSRVGKPTILIENKDYATINVPQKEVKKFIRDTEIQDCCGLFLSQHTGIATKNNYEINFQNGNVLIYVYNVNNNPDKIRTAIDMIDNLKQKLDENMEEKDTDDDIISKENLDEMNREYQLFVQQKLAIIKDIRDNMNKMIKQIDNMEFSSMEKYLSTRYANSNSLFCKNCSFHAKNQRSMNTHLKICIEVAQDENMDAFNDTVAKKEKTNPTTKKEKTVTYKKEKLSNNKPSDKEFFLIKPTNIMPTNIMPTIHIETTNKN